MNTGLEQLDRYVSRSRQQSVFEAAQADLRSLYAVVDGRRSNDETCLGDPLLDLAWEDAFAPDEKELLDPFFDEDEDVPISRRGMTEAPAEERSAQVYRWGKRISGVTWSPGGAISFVQYDKTLEGRLRNKHFMESIWQAAGWNGTASVIRHEARLRRDALRTLGLLGELYGRLDDPWSFLEHIGEISAYIVGQPATEETATSCARHTSHVDVAWIRRVVPDADTNRSRWPTDAVWRLVQAASFTEAPTKARRLMRREQHVHAVEQLDAGAYGYLISRTALLHPHGETFDVSMGLRGWFQALTKIAAQPDKDFGELVRQRRRKRGLPVASAGKVLPFLPVCSDDDPAERTALDAAAERMLDGALHGDALRAARVRLAERRLHEALAALEEAERHPVVPHHLAKPEGIYHEALSAYKTLGRTRRDTPGV